MTDRIKTSLNYQIAKTDQSTAEIYQAGRRVLRTRDTLYEEKQWVFDAQLDKAFSLGETDHQVTYGTTLKQQKVTGSREGLGHLPGRRRRLRGHWRAQPNGQRTA